MVTLAIVTCTATPGAAQLCIGDCDLDGRPVVNELVTGVNILLGRAALAVCATLDSNGNSRVDVNELVRAVADILYGCGVTPPTPLPTETPTRTPTPTATLPATSTSTPTTGPLDASGMWREDQYQIASSDCPDALNQQVADGLSHQPPCTYTLTQNGTELMAEDCDGNVTTGEIDPAGVAQFDLGSGQQTENGCTVTLDAQGMIDVSRSPTTFRQFGQVSFAGTCPLPPCMLEIDSRWTKL